MIEISQDSVLYNYTQEEKSEFFRLILNQIFEIEKSLEVTQKIDNKITAGYLHKIKGTFSYFIEQEILEIIKSLELKAKSDLFTEEDKQNLTSLLTLIKLEIEVYLN